MVTFAAHILLSEVGWNKGRLRPTMSRSLWSSLLRGSPKVPSGKVRTLGFQYLLWPRVPSPSALWWDGPFPLVGLYPSQHHKA